MAQKSSKHENIQTLQIIPNGGVNYSQISIADNELRRANNFIYDPTTDCLVTRPGTSCIVAQALSGPITCLTYYEKSATEMYLVCASGGKLYYFTEGEAGSFLNSVLFGGVYFKDTDDVEWVKGAIAWTSGLWTEIGALNDTTTIPSFLTFNAKLLIADGGSEIKTWDGTTFDTIDSSPDANALSRIKNRVVANSVSELDAVYLSGPYDADSPETAWDTSGDAIGFRAGFGDMMSVVGFGVFGSDLFIFKKGDTNKRTYRLNVSDTTNTNWYVSDVFSSSAAQGAHAISEGTDSILFVDTDGFKAIRGTADYGDIQVDPVGRKINSLFSSQTSCDFMTYIPKYNATWFGMGDKIYCYTERGTYDSDGDAKTIPAFTELTFAQGRIRGICQAGNNVYLAGNDGYLYLFDESLATDAINTDSVASFSSSMRSKTFTFGGDGILRKMQWYLQPKESGVGNIVVYRADGSSVNLKTIVIPGEGSDLYDATGDLYDATGYLSQGEGVSWTETMRSRIRDTQMAFEIIVTSGRIGVEWIKAEIALVEGGD